MAGEQKPFVIGNLRQGRKERKKSPYEEFRASMDEPALSHRLPQPRCLKRQLGPGESLPTYTSSTSNGYYDGTWNLVVPGTGCPTRPTTLIDGQAAASRTRRTVRRRDGTKRRFSRLIRPICLSWSDDVGLIKVLRAGDGRAPYLIVLAVADMTKRKGCVVWQSCICVCVWMTGCHALCGCCDC